MLIQLLHSAGDTGEQSLYVKGVCCKLESEPR